jgi:hypothetical protein
MTKKIKVRSNFRLFDTHVRQFLKLIFVRYSSNKIPSIVQYYHSLFTFGYGLFGFLAVAVVEPMQTLQQRRMRMAECGVQPIVDGKAQIVDV